MRTRGGLFYSHPMDAAAISGRKREAGSVDDVGEDSRRKRSRVAREADLFDSLPDDLVLSIFCRVCASAASPADLASILLTCRRFNELGLHHLVLSRASASCILVRAKNWSEPTHNFLKRCADAGNLEACYMLGMIQFYCLQSRKSGVALMAQAAVGSHAAALYSLAVIQFNGSGGSKDDKDLCAGVALCARAAALGHVNALRELGHCLQDGYGVRRNVAEGRRLLIHANARELAAVLGPKPHRREQHPHGWRCCWLLSDFGCHAAAVEGHPANRFLVEWFAARGAGENGGHGELRPCSYAGCGRLETRLHEFRRCSVCGAANYCSRACQALHWKLTHKGECSPMDRWLDGDGAAAAGAGDAGGGGMN